MLFYFTSTGNCLEVCKTLGGEAVSIPSVLRGNTFTFSDDTIGIVAPVYGGDLPEPVKDFLRKVKLNADYIFGVLTYGSYSGNACGFLHKYCEASGIRLDYVNSILMVDNSFVYFDIEKQIQNLPKKKVDDSIARIKSDVEKRERKLYGITLLRSIVGNLMCLANRSIDYHKKFSIENSCNVCGTCVKVCPMDNLTIENNKPILHERCIRCGACYHNCPQGAIRYEGERSKKQYRNSSISLAEIISANS